MRDYIEKGAAGGFTFSRIRSSLASRNSNYEDGSFRCCNRLGCSTRYYSLNDTQIGNSQKAKNPKASFRSLSSKTISARCSNSPSASTYRKSHQERRTGTLTQDTSNAELRSRQGEGADSESNTVQEETILPVAEDIESPVCHGFTENVNDTLVNCGTKSRPRAQKEVHQHWESSNQGNSSSSLIRHSIASRNISHTNKDASEVARSGAHRRGPKNVGCTSVSDDLPSSFSSPDSGHNRRVDIARKRLSDGQSSSRGKSVVSSVTGPSAPPLSLPERSSPSQQTSRKARNRPTSRADTVLVKKPQARSAETRLRLSKKKNDRSLALSMPVVTSELPQMELSDSNNIAELSTRSLTSIFRNTSGQLGPSSRTARFRSTSQSEDNSTGIINGPLGDSDHYRHIHMEGIAEVLLALEQIDQTEELTYEQLLVLESNFTSGRLAFDDRHRDMRLDIDNMSYEELLALEEKMGTVSTALPEEALSRCLKRSIYKPLSLLPGISGSGDDDTKCSICQEEYNVGDEVGKLVCEHWYHVACIHQWLGQKNWCPICKGSVYPS